MRFFPGLCLLIPGIALAAVDPDLPSPAPVVRGISPMESSGAPQPRWRSQARIFTILLQSSLPDAVYGPKFSPHSDPN